MTTAMAIPSADVAAALERERDALAALEDHPSAARAALDQAAEASVSAAPDRALGLDDPTAVHEDDALAAVEALEAEREQRQAVIGQLATRHRQALGAEDQAEQEALAAAWASSHAG